MTMILQMCTTKIQEAKVQPPLSNIKSVLTTKLKVLNNKAVQM